MSVLSMTGRQLDYWATVYRRTWKGSAVLSFVQPWLYIGAMGVLLGGYVDDAAPGLGGASTYLEFVAPGLLAATAMQVAVSEVMWPVMGAIKWDKTYYSMIASPLRVVDIVAGHLSYATFRVALTSAVFAAVLAVTGIVGSVVGALGAFGAAVLVGLAFAAPVYGFSAGARSEQGFALIYRLGLMPMFLFSGAFFPVSNLVEPLETLARLTPLWHGVELARMSALGTWTPAAVVHVAYLGALAALGAWWAVRRLERRLVV
jgi:lipooligosaccharide transport system permease protein